ncbi:hypothetical protein [Pseudomonas putida]|uniref:hypothetical protein n=1 Tax=Pseudomonas putida TaxID=303 RepID=UPI00062A0D9E|nr:hypothetical protein [Pseudomonas putida]
MKGKKLPLLILCASITHVHASQSDGSKSEAVAVAALCEAMRYQAYNTMELRQLSAPKYKLKEAVDRQIDDINSRLKQYKLIDEAYALALVSPDRAGIVAHEFSESQYEKCMSEQKNVVGL